jgi:hypothetical protein
MKPLFLADFLFGMPPMFRFRHPFEVKQAARHPRTSRREQQTDLSQVLSRRPEHQQGLLHSEGHRTAMERPRTVAK